MNEYPEPEFSEIYDSKPTSYMAQRMMQWPFGQCGVWQAFDVDAKFIADVRTCMRLWERHSNQRWEFNKRPNFKYQIRRIG